MPIETIMVVAAITFAFAVFRQRAGLGFARLRQRTRFLARTSGSSV